MIHRSALASLVMMGLLLGAPVAAEASGRALLVGASQPAEGPALPGAEADVAAMRALLTETFAYPTDDVTSLVGAEATVEAVTTALTALADEAPRGEPVVIYVAGAGTLVADGNQDEPDPWDEGITLADGLLLDDDLHAPLGRILRRASQVSVIIDASAEPASGTPRRHAVRFAGRRTPTRGEVPDFALGEGDGAAHWVDTGAPNLVVVDAARLGAALETKRGGVFTRMLVELAPRRATWGALADTVTTRVAARSVQVPSFVGDGPVFGKEGVGDEVPPVTAFEIPEGGITVTILEGDRPMDVPGKEARRLRKEIARDREIARRVRLVEPEDGGDWVVRRDPTSGSIEIVGPEGAVRNRVDDDDLRTAANKAAQNLMLHGQQAALLDMDIPTGPLALRMVPTEQQSPCAYGEWVAAGAHEVQVVPVCWRWQVEVTLTADAEAPAEVGVVVMGNDGTLLGFPMEGDPVVLQPGETHRFALKRPGRDPGLRSVPPLDITEHLLAFAAPAGANVDFDAVTGWAARDVAADGTAPAAEGRWYRQHLPYRVQAVPPRPEDLPRDPEARRREITLDGFDVTPYLPANPNAFLTKVLQQADRLAKFRPTRDGGRDGLAYAQCWPHDRKEIHDNRTRFSERAWPGETCWERPFDFTRDDIELGESPGIDCSSAMWFVITRACKGDARLPLPEKQPRERNAAYAARLRQFHENDRQCLLFTNENFRAGFVSTNIMANHPEIMKDHFVDCMGLTLQTGDILVTRNARNTGGHTYLIVDPDRFVVFGSHAGDASWARMSAEERAIWEGFERLDPGARDAGVEYQFLAWWRKSDLVGTELEKWGGYARERLKACWRHAKIAEEWSNDPTSRPGTRRTSRVCSAESCR